MEKFIKKLINRLEEQSGKAEQEMNYYRELSEEDASCEVFADAHEKSYEAYCNAIGIAYEIAEEYNNESVKGDLISRQAVIDIIHKEIERTTSFAEHDTQINIEFAVNDLPTAYNNGWIPCSEKMPPVETEVWIVAKRKWKDGTYKYVTTTAMYEDGTVLENDSCWRWEDIEGEWNEEEDCCIIPEGWWENKHYNADGELNHAVDDEVIAWQPLPQPYQPKGDSNV